MKTLIASLSLVLLTGSAYAEQAPVIDHGEQLHNEKCLSCHSYDVYIRQDRRVTSLGALSSQVNNCMKGPAGANWTVSETNAVIEYLNSRFYKF